MKKRFLLLFMALLLVTSNLTSLAQTDNSMGIERKIYKFDGDNLVEISEEQYRTECKEDTEQKVDEINNRQKRSILGGHTFRRTYDEHSNDEYKAFIKYYSIPRKNNSDDPTKLNITRSTTVEGEGSFNISLSSKIKETLESTIGFGFSKKVSHTVSETDQLTVRPGKYGYIYVVGNIYATKGTYTKHHYSSTTGRHLTSYCESKEIDAKIIKSVYIILETSWSEPTFNYMDRLN